MSAWVTRVVELISRNADALPYSDLGKVKTQLISLGLYPFHVSHSDFRYGDRSTKRLIRFSGLIEIREDLKYAVIGWLTPNFPTTAPTVYLLPKYNEGVLSGQPIVKLWGQIQIPYLDMWSPNHTLAELLDVLAKSLSTRPLLVRRPRRAHPVASHVLALITDKLLKKSLKQLLGDFPKLKVNLLEEDVSIPMPFVSGYIPISYNGSEYKVNIEMWFRGFPQVAPEIYVKWNPTESHIDPRCDYVSKTSGRVQTPLIMNWCYLEGFEDYCTLVGLIWNLVDLFSLKPPVRAGVSVPLTLGSNRASEMRNGEDMNRENGNEPPDYQRQQRDRENEAKVVHWSGWLNWFGI